MNADALAKLVRNGNAAIRVSEVSLETDTGPFNGTGTIRVENDGFTLEFYSPSNSQPPPQKFGTFSAREYWKVSGIIEEILPFRCDLVPPGGKRSHSRNQIRESICTELRLHAIEIPAHGTEALSSKQLAELFSRIQATNGTDDPVGPDLHEFTASLPNYPQIFRNAITEESKSDPFFGELTSSSWNLFIDDLSGFTFALEHDDQDLSVHMRSLPASSGMSCTEARRQFEALLHAVAITHGQHAWPYHQIHHYGTKKTFEQIAPPKKLTEAFNLPFDHSLTEALPPDDIRHRSGSSIRLLAKFLYDQPKLGDKIVDLAFLFREAQKREVHHDIESLTICVLFESLVTLLF